MCDQDHYDEDLKAYRARSMVTRRTFGAMSLGASAMAMLPRVANAAAVTESDVKVKTPDGTADCYFAYPSGGASAGVIMWPDILGLRPAFRDMGKRLAESGYAVLVVNPYYRGKPAPVVPAGAKFSDPEVKKIVSPLAQALNDQRPGFFFQGSSWGGGTSSPAARSDGSSASPAKTTTCREPARWRRTR